MEELAGTQVFASVLACDNNPALLRTLICLREQTTRPAAVLVVDNGSSEAVQDYLDRRGVALEAHESIVRVEENRGVGAGHNIGLRRAMQSDCRLIWMLEHDTFVLPNCLATMLGYFAEASDAQRLALHPVLARNRYEAEGMQLGRPLPDEPATGGFAPVHALTFNGLLLPASMVREIGPIREDLMVGMEDFDYHGRLVACGGRLDATTEVLAVHANKGKGRDPEPHSPMRSFYAVRNKLWLRREVLGRVPIGAAAESSLGVLRDLATGDLELARAKFRGLMAGLRTRSAEPVSGW